MRIYEANQMPGHPMLNPCKESEPEFWATESNNLTKSSKPSLWKVNPNLLVLLASMLSWGDHSTRGCLFCSKNFQMMTSLRLCSSWKLRKKLQVALHEKKCDQIWAKSYSFWALFERIGPVFDQVLLAFNHDWAILGKLLRPGLALGRVLRRSKSRAVNCPSGSSYNTDRYKTCPNS